MRNKLFALMLAATTIAPAALSQTPPTEAPPSPPTEAAADTTTNANGLVGTPPEGKGQIVFFRPSKFAGAAVGFKVREGETELGKLRSGNYFVHVAEPGTHEYNVHSETNDVLAMEVEAGETYYVEGTINMGFMVGRPNISPSTQAAFDAISGKLKPSK